MNDDYSNTQQKTFGVNVYPFSALSISVLGFLPVVEAPMKP
jgi:hypothetical protein